MNLTRGYLSFAIALSSGALATAATTLNNVVSEQSAVIVSLHDVPAIISGWQKSPWAKTWNDDQVKKFFAPLRDQMKIEDWDTTVKEKTGYTLTDLLGFATGDAIIAVPNLSSDSASAEKVPPILIGFDVGPNAEKVQKLFEKSAKDENATEETSTFSGVVVHVIHPASKDKAHPGDPLVWAIVEQKWFLGPSKEAIDAAIDAVHNGGADHAWGRSERWADLQKRAGAAQIILSLNVEALYPLMKQGLDTKMKNGGAARGPFAVDAETLLTALGLDAWREIYLTTNFGDESTDIQMGLSYSAERGLTKLAAYHDGPIVTPNFISKKCVNVSTSKLSGKDAYASLEEMLNAVSPAIGGLLQGQLRSLNKQLGIDLKRDFIGSLGDTVIGARFQSSDSGETAALSDLDQFIAVSLQNTETFGNAVDSFQRLMGPQADQFFKTRDFLGFKITTFTPGGVNRPGVKPFHYAIAKGYFFLSVGSASPLESALRGLVQDQESIWTQKDVAAALAQVPSNANAFEYEDMGQLVTSFFKTVAKTSSLISQPHAKPDSPPEESEAPEKTGDSEATDAAPEAAGAKAEKRWVDAAALPDSDTIAKYWSYGWGYVVKDSSGIHGTSKIIYPK